jgi:hypothetical protein
MYGFRLGVLAILFVFLLASWPTLGWAQSPLDAFASDLLAGSDSARSRFLASSPDPEMLRDKISNGSGKEKLAARIALGWLQHNDLFERALRSRLRDQVGTLRYTFLTYRQKSDVRYLGLVYELALAEKDPRQAHDLATYLSLASNELAWENLDEIRALYASAHTPMTRSVAAGALAKSPLSSEEALDFFRKELWSDRKSQAVLDAFSGAVITSTSRGPEVRKDVVASLAPLIEVGTDRDQARIVSMIGTIGGEDADRLVAKSLTRAPNEAAQFSAINLLAASTTPIAGQALSEFFVSGKAELPTRYYALDKLKQHQFDERVAKELSVALTQKDAPVLTKKKILEVYEFWLQRAKPDSRPDVERAVKDALPYSLDSVFEDVQRLAPYNDLKMLKGLAPKK